MQIGSERFGPATLASPSHAQPAGGPRLLFLCQTLPHPPNNGVLIRSFNVLRLLSRHFDITALCFYRRESHSNSQEVTRSLEALRQLAYVEAFPIPHEHSKARLLADHVRSLITQKAYTIYTYESRDFRHRLASLLRRQTFDLVHMDSLDLATYIPVLEERPVVCVHHNVESQLLRRRAATAPGLLGSYIRMQAQLTEKEERRWCPKVELNVAVSGPDKDEFLRLAPSGKFVVIPNGVDTEKLKPVDMPRDGIVFVGSHGWQPNRDAMEHFCTSVLPHLRARGISTEVTWVGRASDRVINEYADRFGVKMTGFVEDFRPLVHRAACYIAPLRAGGGTRLKILDAWSLGKAVVSTSVGCEGLDARDGENILIRDDPEDFANAVAQVLDDPQLRERLEIAARRTAVSVYDWELIGDRMLESYFALIGRG